MSGAENLQVIEGGRDPSSVLGREQPCSAEAEESLLSCVLLGDGGEALAIARHVGVPPAAFYWPMNREIWRIVLELADRGEATDLLTLRAELDARRLLEGVGGMERLLQVSSRVATTIQARYFAETVKLLWERRYAIAQGTAFVECCHGAQKREEFAEAASQLGQRLIRLGRRENLRALEEVIDGVSADIARRAAGQIDKSGWIYTRLARFDEKCKPLGSQREDHMVVIAGGSGDGKSTIIRQWCGEALRQGQRVLVYNRETSTDGFIEQLAGSWSTFDLNEPDRQPHDRLEKFRQCCENLKKAAVDRRLWLVQQEAATPLTTIEDLADHARAHVNLHGPMGLWAADYAQLFGTRRRFNNREQEMAYVSHTFQSLVRELGGVWLIGCQFNEAGLREMRTGRRDDKGRLIHRLPQRGDLRESQSFFHDADRVEGLYRPPEDCRGQEQTSPNILSPEVWLVQMKRRRGGEGCVRCWFQKMFTRFVEVGAVDLATDEESGGLVKKSYMAKKQARPEQPSARANPF